MHRTALKTENDAAWKSSTVVEKPWARVNLIGARPFLLFWLEVYSALLGFPGLPVNCGWMEPSGGTSSSHVQRSPCNKLLTLEERAAEVQDHQGLCLRELLPHIWSFWWGRGAGRCCFTHLTVLARNTCTSFLSFAWKKRAACNIQFA